MKDHPLLKAVRQIKKISSIFLFFSEESTERNALKALHYQKSVFNTLEFYEICCFVVPALKDILFLISSPHDCLFPSSVVLCRVFSLDFSWKEIKRCRQNEIKIKAY